MWPGVSVGHRVALEDVKARGGKAVELETLSTGEGGTARVFYVHNFLEGPEADHFVRLTLDTRPQERLVSPLLLTLAVTSIRCHNKTSVDPSSFLNLTSIRWSTDVENPYKMARSTAGHPSHGNFIPVALLNVIAVVYCQSSLFALATFVFVHNMSAHNRIVSRSHRSISLICNYHSFVIVLPG